MNHLKKIILIKYDKINRKTIFRSGDSGIQIQKGLDRYGHNGSFSTSQWCLFVADDKGQSCKEFVSVLKPPVEWFN